ncbi:MAG: Ubiquinone biosynthesis protein [Parcubacteria group bacterium GW2011_GWA1_40_21]|nr:MAG: Ubiquinone biosynthesis protein [Parcubacteria group bacterium GW2011_GWC1_40_13]KKR53752.1 MAG: Ubiquinone biosynthesis protein [Parcubacteria group bacterium GW2011_GWA1_40_21]
MTLFLERLFYILKIAIRALSKPDLTKPQRLKLFFEESGGAFIKLGQILALRRDFLPAEYTLELLKLLNDMPAVPFSEVNKIFTEDIGEPVEKFFASFDSEPIGSASVAQVYKAVLKNGEEVAVKILRPGTEKVFKVDFLIISFFASAIDLLNLTSFLSVREVATDFIRWTKRELDFRHESNNAVAFLKYSKGAPGTIIPKQHQEYTSSRVLIQELILGGVSVLDIILGKYSREQLIEKRINPDKMALYLIKDAMRQYFIDGFFHADAHPANLAFLPGDENSPEGKIAYFDFGIVGEAEKESRMTLLKFVYAVSAKDIELIAKYLLEYGRKNFKKELLYSFEVEPVKQKIVNDIIGIIEKDIVSHFKTEVQEIMGSWFVDEKDIQADLKKRSSALVFMNLVRKAEKYGVHFPLDIILFFRGLVIIDMVALQISPQFDIIKAMESFFEKHSIEEIEIKVRSQANWKEIDKKIISLNDDWESSGERLIMQKEKVAIMRERILEIVFYYAERHPEIKNLIKQL